MTISKKIPAVTAMVLALATPIVTAVSFLSDDLPFIAGVMAAVLALLIGQSYRRVLVAGLILFVVFVVTTIFDSPRGFPWLITYALGVLTVSSFVGLVSEFRNRDIDTSANSDPQPTRKVKLLAYGFPAITCAVMSQLWFGWDYFLARADVGPFVYSGIADEISWVWNHAMTGAGSASSRISLAMLVYWNEFWTALGLSEAFSQRLFFAVLFGSVGAGGAYLAGSIIRNPYSIAAAGLVSGINVYLMMYILQPIYTLSIACIAILGGVLVRVMQERPPRVAVFALLSLPLSYVANNPPSFVLVLISLAALVLIFALNDLGPSLKRVLRYLLRATPIVIALHLWWIVPYAFAMLIGDGFELGAITDPVKWKWSHKLATPENVMSLSGQWSWGNERYHPYMTGMTQAGWNWMKYILPAFVLCAPIVAKRKHRVTSLALLCTFIVLVFASKGINAPFASLNMWFFDHVPTAWLFREPFPKFGIAIVVVVGLQVAIATVGIIELLASSSTKTHLKNGARTVLALAVLLTIIYPYPLWTSTVVTGSGDFPPSRVKLPSEFHAAADAIESSQGDGKVLQLPLLDYHQILTSWHYYGTDNILQRLIERPVIKPEPSGYFGASNSFTTLARLAEEAIVQGDNARAGRLLEALGVSHVVVRNDFLQLDGHDRDITPPQVVQAQLSNSPIVSKTQSFGRYLDVFEIGSSRGLVRSSGVARPVLNDDAAASVSTSQLNEVVVSGIDSTELPVSGSAPVIAYNAKSPAEYRINVEASSTPYAIVLADSFSSRWKLSGLPAGLSAKHVMVDGYANGWLIKPHAGALTLTAEYEPAKPVRLIVLLSGLAIVLTAIWLITPNSVRERWRNVKVRSLNTQ